MIESKCQNRRLMYRPRLISCMILLNLSLLVENTSHAAEEQVPIRSDSSTLLRLDTARALMKTGQERLMQPIISLLRQNKMSKNRLKTQIAHAINQF